MSDKNGPECPAPSWIQHHSAATLEFGTILYTTHPHALCLRLMLNAGVVHLLWVNGYLHQLLRINCFASFIDGLNVLHMNPVRRF